MIDTPVTHEELDAIFRPIFYTLGAVGGIVVGSRIVYALWCLVSYPFRPLPDGRTYDWRKKHRNQ